VTQKNQFILVVGPHRSGSSLVAAALHSLGVNLGKQFIAPNEDNPKGFFEDEDIVRFNDRLLRSLNLSWDSFGFIWEMDFNTLKLKPYHNAAVGTRIATILMVLGRQDLKIPDSAYCCRSGKESSPRP
jgi:hypothetical protein